jgi:hypothetical protein
MLRFTLVFEFFCPLKKAHKLQGHYNFFLQANTAAHQAGNIDEKS